MGKVLSWMCLIWNAISFLFGALVVAISVIGSLSTNTPAWLVAFMAVIFVGGPGLGIATALIGARIIRSRKLEGQVARVFD